MINPVLPTLTPRQIVEELDKYIIGQKKAKKAVAIALRNRVRRSHLPEELRDEVAPKNIIMIGPTGVGKTEIARRLSRLSGAPFIKVEATKFTEVGYTGRDVESMIRDLTASAVSMVKAELREGVRQEAEQAMEEELLDILLPGRNVAAPQDHSSPPTSPPPGTHTREILREKLRRGELDERKVTISTKKGHFPSIEIFSGTGMEEMDLNLGALTNMIGGGGRKKRTVSVKQAEELLLAEQKDRLIDLDTAVEIARDRVQNMGIIFIDEIDKIAHRSGHSHGPDVSREGVQRDILPIVEGCTVSTKFGAIDTSHILFIAAGAFNLAKPFDLIPELQGRFPIRVELEDLNASDFRRILTDPKNALTRQYEALLKTEDITLTYTPEAVKRIAEIVEEVNNLAENIGARRLHTVMERLLEEISFNADQRAGETVVITEEYVNTTLMDLLQNRDLSRYIL